MSLRRMSRRRISATPGRIDRLAPTLGQDTDAVLHALGINPPNR